jgi:hypothetical protein
MFDHWFSAVYNRLKEDTAGWGLANRFECKDWEESHEGIIATALEKSGFDWGDERYPDATRRKADGVVLHPQHPKVQLRYEIKSVFLPHYGSPGDKHGQDYERLLRLEHPNGALGDVERLRLAPEPLRVFLLLAISWTGATTPEKLPLYEEHRGILLEAFQKLAKLGNPEKQAAVRGADTIRPWSADLRVWLV